MKLYKFTDQDGYTRRGETGETLWKVGKTVSVLKKCKTPRLCTKDVIHAYDNLNLGLLLNPIHANLSNPRIFVGIGERCVRDYEKVGTFSLKITKELTIPTWFADPESKSMVQVRFACLCARSVLSVFEDRYPTDDRVSKAIEAAEEYLRTKSAHAAAADAAVYAAHAAHAAVYAAAADAAVYAAHAVHAAYAAVYAAHAAHAVHAAYAAVYAAHAVHAAYAAVYAADAAYAADAGIDLTKLADKAVRMERRKG